MALKSLLMGAAAVATISTVSCSDPVPPPSQGGAYVEINAAPAGVTPAGRKCSIQGHSAQIGNPPPSGSSPGKRVVDGEGGASVSCRVSKSGGGYKFNGTAQHNKVTFYVNGEVTSGAGTAKVTTYDPTSLATLGNPSDTPCEVTVTEPLQVASGRIWAAFKCPAFVDISQPDGPLFCEAEAGWFVFENCDE